MSLFFLFFKILFHLHIFHTVFILYDSKYHNSPPHQLLILLSTFVFILFSRNFSHEILFFSYNISILPCAFDLSFMIFVLVLEANVINEIEKTSSGIYSISTPFCFVFFCFVFFHFALSLLFGSVFLLPFSTPSQFSSFLSCCVRRLE
jgi:hypothetical protein